MFFSFVYIKFMTIFFSFSFFTKTFYVTFLIKILQWFPIALKIKFQFLCILYLCLLPSLFLCQASLRSALSVLELHWSYVSALSKRSSFCLDPCCPLFLCIVQFQLESHLREASSSILSKISLPSCPLHYFLSLFVS